MKCSLRRDRNTDVGWRTSRLRGEVLEARRLLSAVDVAELLESRVSWQTAIEEVYWRHRTQPAENQQPRKPFSEAMPASVIQSKVEDSLLKSAALERYWGRPITSSQLQAEIERMAENTARGDMLGELWAALGNDPYQVAEGLARPALADRLVRNWYAIDDRVHGQVKEQAKIQLEQHDRAAEMQRLDGSYGQTTWLRRENADATPTRSHEIVLDAAAWDQETARLARLYGGSDFASLQIGQMSGLQEDATRFYVTAVTAKEDDRLTVAVTEWHKQSFDDWWSGARKSLALSLPATMHEYRLPALAMGSTGTDDTWATMQHIPEARYDHVAVWTGSEMIVWGGGTIVGTYFREGGRYDPATDTWADTSLLNAPSARWRFDAVWTGDEMIVWGGSGYVGDSSGGRYDPVTDTWMPTAQVGAPAPRIWHETVWTGTEMIIWGGLTGTGTSSNTGGVYDPQTDSWRATSLLGAPVGRMEPAAVWTGSEMIVWGGFRDPDPAPGGGRYNPVTNTWQATSEVDAPVSRLYPQGVWTGSDMIVWGGLFTPNGNNSGGRYDPLTDTWQATSMVGAPSNRWHHAQVWTGTEMLVWGGSDSFSIYGDGARYDPKTDTWLGISSVSAPSARWYVSGVWTGDELIVWGGQDDDRFVATGGRYDPSSDSWLGVSTYNLPTGRQQHAAVWTGAEMVVYGGFPYSNTGGRYDPATDTWQPTTTVGAPIGEQRPVAVWTGGEVIFWGGNDSRHFGTRYDPALDSWRPTSLVNAPSRRYAHKGVWTGSELIIWGGATAFGTENTGGRYNPVTDTWRPTSTVGAWPHRSNFAVAWTGSEMLMWGGFPYNGDPAGRGYNPVSDTWRTLSIANQPETREWISYAWTGKEMVIWGGQQYVVPVRYFNDGGRYDPMSNTWRPVNMLGAPSIRSAPDATVWTGNEMIVWSGYPALGGDFNTGGRYNPHADTWRATSTFNTPSARSNGTAVWTGEEMIVWGGGTQFANGGRYRADVDLTSPVVNFSEFAFNTAPQSIRFTFSEDVSDSLSVQDLLLMNLTTNQPVPPATIALAYDVNTNIATFTFPVYQYGALPNGNYRATLPEGSVTDPSGNPLAAHWFEFFFLNGDANHDGRVNLNDYNILAANFGQEPRTFSQGDFNYDGRVNLADYNILASRFGDTVGPGTSTDGLSPRGSPFRDSGKKAADDLLDALLA